MRGGSAELVHSESGDFGRGARWDNSNALPEALPVLYHLPVLHLRTATCSDSPPSATSTHCYRLTFHCAVPSPAIYGWIPCNMPRAATACARVTHTYQSWEDIQEKDTRTKDLYVWGKALVTTRTNPIKGEANIKGKSCVYAFSFHSQEYRWTVSEFSSSISEPAVYWEWVHVCWLNVAFTPTIRKHLAGKQWRPQVSPLANWPPLR